MDWQVLLTNEALKNIKKLPSFMFERVKAAIREIAQDPFSSGKPLKGGLSGQFSYRLGDYRLVYVPVKKRQLIYILYVRHRRDAYR